MNLDDIGRIGDIDQAQAAITMWAGLAGAYYASLIAAHVPPTLADNLVLDWHNALWYKINWPNNPPSEE